jgi:hypothetical protein
VANGRVEAVKVERGEGQEQAEEGSQESVVAPARERSNLVAETPPKKPMRLAKEIEEIHRAAKKKYPFREVVWRLGDLRIASLDGK